MHCSDAYLINCGFLSILGARANAVLPHAVPTGWICTYGADLWYYTIILSLLLLLTYRYTTVLLDLDLYLRGGSMVFGHTHTHPPPSTILGLPLYAGVPPRAHAVQQGRHAHHHAVGTPP